MNGIKKIIAVLTAAAAVMLTSTTVFANVYTGEVKGCTYSFDDETGTLTIYGKGNMAYSFPEPWMDAGFSIRAVETAVISEGITTVGMYTFKNFTNLKTVVIPEGVTLIGESAFENCKSLKEVALPSTVKRIAVNAFRGSGIENINFPDKLESIERTAFYDCPGLTSIELNNSLKKVFSAFLSTGLTSVVIPKDVEYIAEHAFGFYYRSWNEYPVDGFIVYGAAGSKAQEYAEESGLTFVPLDVVTVTFDTDGKCTPPKPQSFLAGGRISAIDEPYAEGYVFDGWYYDKGLSEKFDGSDRMTQSKTLYAKWGAITEGAVFINDDTEPKTVYYGDNIAFNSTIGGGVQMRVTASYTDKDGNEHSGVSVAVGNKMPLTAKFTSSSYGRVFSPDNKTIRLTLQYFQSGPGWVDAHEAFVRVVYKQGDINADGSVDDVDVKTLIRCLGGIERFYGDPLKRANMNNDGTVDMLDVVKMLEKYQGTPMS